MPTKSMTSNACHGDRYCEVVVSYGDVALITYSSVDQLKQVMKKLPLWKSGIWPLVSPLVSSLLS